MSDTLTDVTLEGDTPRVKQAMSESNPPTQPPSVDEPFGQRGVRAHAAAILTALMVIGAACAGALWYRSLDRNDHLVFRNTHGNLHIDSTWGRIRIYTEPFPVPVTGIRSSWSMGGSYIDPGKIIDGWDASFWKTIGIEYRNEPLNKDPRAGAGLGAGQAAVSGSAAAPSGAWWIRIKWYLVVILLLVFPLWKVLSLVWRRGDADE